ncbi:hypothetical protein MMC15_001811, partial [Xylographa vitiligo]|nr:hypothetical protein [Xylographa vitiligo]
DANTSVRRGVSTPNATASRPKHIEYDDISAPVSEQRVTSIEAENADHGPAESTSGSVCHECGVDFGVTSSLDCHAWEVMHEVRRCKCGKGFTRIGDLARHLQNFQRGSAKFPCTHCRRHRGDKSFKRKDHLTQHLRNYHHIDVQEREIVGWSVSSHASCPHSECPHFRDEAVLLRLSSHERKEQRAFRIQAAYTKHMREAHDESPFPCDVAHCPKIGGKGYFRKRTMLKHRKRDHPDAPKYIDPEDKGEAPEH